MDTSKGIEQAEVMRRWHEQQALHESERDILEWRGKNSTAWGISLVPTWNFMKFEYRLRKRPRKQTVTVYLYHSAFAPFPSLEPMKKYSLLGQADITYEEPNNDAR